MIKVGTQDVKEGDFVKVKKFYNTLKPGEYEIKTHYGVVTVVEPAYFKMKNHNSNVVMRIQNTDEYQVLGPETLEHTLYYKPINNKYFNGLTAIQEDDALHSQYYDTEVS